MMPVSTTHGISERQRNQINNWVVMLIREKVSTNPIASSWPWSYLNEVGGRVHRGPGLASVSGRAAHGRADSALDLAFDGDVRVLAASLTRGDAIRSTGRAGVGPTAPVR